MGYTLNLSASLAFLHSNRVIHRDLKPANILLRLIHQLSSQPAAAGDQWQSVIADFGNSAIVQHQKVAEGGVSCAAKWAATGRALSRRVCTLWYAAPEMLLPHETYCFGADVFSMGLVLLEIEALSAACPTRPGAPDWEQLRACWRLCQPAAATHGFPARASGVSTASMFLMGSNTQFVCAFRRSSESRSMVRFAVPSICVPPFGVRPAAASRCADVVHELRADLPVSCCGALFVDA